MTEPKSLIWSVEVEGVGTYTYESLYVPGFVADARKDDPIQKLVDRIHPPHSDPFFADFAVAFMDGVDGLRKVVADNALDIYTEWRNDDTPG